MLGACNIHADRFRHAGIRLLSCQETYQHPLQEADGNEQKGLNIREHGMHAYETLKSKASK